MGFNYRCPTHFTTVFIPMATRLVLFAACSTLASSSQVDLEALASVCEGGACVGGEEASLLQVLTSKHEVANGAEAADDTEAETTGDACTGHDLKILSPEHWDHVGSCFAEFIPPPRTEPAAACLNALGFPHPLSRGCVQCFMDAKNVTMFRCQALDAKNVAPCSIDNWFKPPCRKCVSDRMKLACT